MSPPGSVPSSQHLLGNGATGKAACTSSDSFSVVMTIASTLARLDVSWPLLSLETNAVSFDPNGMHVALFADDFADTNSRSRFRRCPKLERCDRRKLQTIPAYPFQTEAIPAR